MTNNQFMIVASIHNNRCLINHCIDTNQQIVTPILHYPLLHHAGLFWKTAPAITVCFNLFLECCLHNAPQSYINVVICNTYIFLNYQFNKMTLLWYLSHSCHYIFHCGLLIIWTLATFILWITCTVYVFMFMKNLLHLCCRPAEISLIVCFSSSTLPLEGGKPASLRNSPDSLVSCNWD